MSIQLDQSGIPHVVWSDGRNNEMDIYYAYGLTILPQPQPFPIELVVIIVIVLIIEIISVVFIFRYRLIRNFSKKKKEEKQIKNEE